MQQDLLGAVSTEKISTKNGLLQRLFAVYFDAFVYNQIWEDPEVDLAALEIDADSRILTISSGGCNVLNYLIAEPRSITAVDLNRYHIYLLRLKLAAVRNLPTAADLFAFFGEGKSDRNLDNFRRFIEPNLDDDTRDFWRSNGPLGKLIHGQRINYFHTGGLYERSRNGYFLRFFHAYARLLGLDPTSVVRAKTPDEQRLAFKNHVEPFFDSLLIRILGRSPITTFGLGIPPQQLAELRSDLGHGSLLDVYRERTRRLVCDYPMSENYFAWQAFARQYDVATRRAVPSYLKEENFELLKDRSHTVQTGVSSVTAQILANPRGTFNRFVFLDAQDWMDDRTMTELWQAIAERAEPRSRIIFRTASARSPLAGRIPAELLSKFAYDPDASRELHARDRASIYGGFHLYTLNK